MRAKEKRFRLRGPCMAIENEQIPEQYQDSAWQEAIEWFNKIPGDRVHSFRLQVNFHRKTKEAAALEEMRSK